jgi:translocation and assembly module TamB
LARDGGLDLKAAGTADLSLFNVDLSAAGRRVLGKVVVDAVVRGTPSVPDISGSMELHDSEIQDGADGCRIAGISGAAMFTGSTVQIVNLSGRAGAGTIKVTGNVDLGAPGIPVRLTLTARNAEPVSSDSFHANLDADMTVTGSATGRLQVAGKVVVRRAESVLPNSLPPAVATLNVARSGKKEFEKPASVRPSAIAFNVDISSPGQLFVRGRGLDAELEGNLHLGGSLAAPAPTGAFEMRRGTFDLGGATLNFTSGKVTFQNASLRNGLDPELDFVAQSATGSYTAKLEVTGTVSAPKVQLSSTPTLPQDEILSQLLFQQNVKQLTALQLAQMAQAAASLGGFSGGFDPLASARRLLGLDRLSVVSGPNNQTQIEGGKYVSRNIYVGAKQGLSSAPQAEVQIDLTKHLKARAAIATGSSATVTQGNQQQDPGTSAGLSWQFEY